MADKGTRGERISLPLWSCGTAACIAWEAGKNFAAGSVIGDGIISSIYHFASTASTVGTYTAGAFAAAGVIGLIYQNRTLRIYSWGGCQAVGKGPVITVCEKIDEWLHIGDRMHQAEMGSLSESEKNIKNSIADVNRVSAQDINYDASSGEGNVLPTEDGAVSGQERHSPFSTTPRPK